MRSSWDETVAKSQYHFDTTIMDPRWDTVIGLGRIDADFSSILDDIVSNSKPANWESRGYKGQGKDIPPVDLEKEEYDLERIGADPKMIITHLNWNIPPLLQQISDAFGMEDSMNRIHVQMPGEVWNLHIDKLQKWCPENPHKVLRVQIQLTDWQQGHFWSYGNYVHTGWRAGDVTTFDWQNLPHSTANAGHSPRVTFQITGVMTEKTIEFIQRLRSSNSISFKQE